MKPKKTPSCHDCGGPTPPPTAPSGQVLVFCVGCEEHRRPGYRAVCDRCAVTRAAAAS